VAVAEFVAQFCAICAWFEAITPTCSRFVAPLERVIACGLQVTHSERLIEHNRGKGIGLDQAAWLHKKADVANRRYLSAIKALAQVRRLQVPLSVQVNVAAQGGQQVNVSGVTPGG
jgi:hypothetical protein